MSREITEKMIAVPILCNRFQIVNIDPIAIVENDEKPFKYYEKWHFYKHHKTAVRGLQYKRKMYEIRDLQL